MSENFGNHLVGNSEDTCDSERIDFRVPNMNSAEENSPSFFIPDEVIDECLDEWKFSLIGRLDLVKLKMNTVSEALLKQWQLKGKVQFIPLGKSFFIIKLDNLEDINHIWQGFWKVDTQILCIRSWEPNFNPAAQKTTSAYVWVIFPGLSIEYWKESILMQMGSILGRAIKVDEITLKRVVGYYACVLVEIDISKSIPNSIWVNSKYGKFEQPIQAPNKPKFCSHCKSLGHFVIECRTKRKENSQTTFADGFISKPKKQWKLKKLQSQQIGFDICGSTPSETNKDRVSINTSSASTSSHQDVSSGRFHLLQDNTTEYNGDFPPLATLESQKHIGESSGVVKEIQCSDINAQVTITASQVNQPIITEDSSDSSSEDGEIKEVSNSYLLLSNTLTPLVIILRNDPTSPKIVTKKIITEKKKAPAKPTKPAPVTRKTSKERVLSSKGNSPQKPQ
ncbi:uncharacterized protein LOC113312773 [Papaver somniferum]|uniref:uncharacterized protein LOC113312773 n=1 Tax=Papaver somniferum TaxID=3469 RepID=UPI000E701010|nr:uncharacterized protein LOC113312773 [Papaver somniferum]